MYVIWKIDLMLIQRQMSSEERLRKALRMMIVKLGRRYSWKRGSAQLMLKVFLAQDLIYMSPREVT
jgi:hypothetical protein